MTFAPEETRVMGEIVRRIWITLPPPKIEVGRRDSRTLGEDTQLHELVPDVLLLHRTEWRPHLAQRRALPHRDEPRTFQPPAHRARVMQASEQWRRDSTGRLPHAPKQRWIPGRK